MIVVAKVEKTTPQQKLGITLRKDNHAGTYHLSKVDSNSPFVASSTEPQQLQLQEGMKVLKINGMPLLGKPMNFVMMLLKESTSITIIAEKEGDKDGGLLPFKSNEPSSSKNNVASSNLQPYVPRNSATSNTVNDDRAYYDNATTTTTTTTTISSSLTTPVQQQQQQQSPIIIATMTKERADQKLGISLARDSRHGLYVISMLSPTSPFAIMGLKVGMKILKINNIEITGQPMTVAMTLLKESIGDVTVTAVEIPTTTEERGCDDDPLPPLRPPLPGGGPSSTNTAALLSSSTNPKDSPVVEATLVDEPASLATTNSSHDSIYSVEGRMTTNTTPQPTTTTTTTSNNTIRSVVTKTTTHQKLGISMNRDSRIDGGTFIIGSIASSSPFQTTSLKVGMRVISINGIEITGLDMNTVMTIILSSVGDVVLVTTRLDPPEQDIEEWV